MSKEHFYDIIKSPAITEKANADLREQPGRLQRGARRHEAEIKKAVEGLFGVKVKAVNTLVRKGKQRRFRASRPR